MDPVSGNQKRNHGSFAFGTNTVERAMMNPSPMTRHFTNFKHDFTDPVDLGNVVCGDGAQDNRKFKDAGPLRGGEK
jgi:hypothetical protein